jgi:hypothetical protein
MRLLDERAPRAGRRRGAVAAREHAPQKQNARTVSDASAVDFR